MGSLDDLRSLLYDVVVHMQGPVRHRPVPGRLNVLWVVDNAGGPGGTERGRYDLVVTADSARGSSLSEECANLIDAAVDRARSLGLPARVEPQIS